MKKNELYQKDGRIIRVLKANDDKAFVIDCMKETMPEYMRLQELEEYVLVTDCKYNAEVDLETLPAEIKRVAYERYTLIAGILPHIEDKSMRTNQIEAVAVDSGMSKQTIRKYLCKYLVYQNVAALAPKPKEKQKELSQDEKNMRWALNKFFYNKNKNSLKTAYTLMLKNKYCDDSGNLQSEYPSYYQFRYFYRKTRKMQTYYISRDGIKNYQRNNRPCVGDGVQEYANASGVGMLDATVLDIYLVNGAGQLVGRPSLTACIDAFSGLCCGYSLLWEGGVYSLRNMMLNVISDKVEHCKKNGILINESDWSSKEMPGKLISDQGAEYVCDTFSQIAELGVTLVNLPAFRPELKGPVEKFFDLIQDMFKPYLKGKGVIEPDYRERGAHDYRKDACLTLDEFEKIILRCIIFYNSQRVVEDFPYTEAMLNAEIKPYANCLWEYGKTLDGANLISVSAEQVVLTLLPRTVGKFTRFGLKVNKMRYHHVNYVEKYLQGSEVTVAYNPDDVTYVWVIENGAYIRFDLIESRFKGKELEEVTDMKKRQRKLVKDEEVARTQAEIRLATHIEAISKNAVKSDKVNIKGVRETRKREQSKQHVDYVKEAGVNEQNQ